MRPMLALSLGMLFSAVAVRADHGHGTLTGDFTKEEAAAAEDDPRRYQIDPNSVRIVKLGPGTVRMPAPDGDDQPAPGGVIDDIINIGSKIWDIIEKNQPVVDVSTTYANAFPRGVEHWTDLGGWKPPEATLYAFYADNLYGHKAINVRYQVIRMHSGTYQGKGKYLNHVTIEPLNVDVGWGYRFSLGAAIPNVANVGSSQDPVASMLATLKWQINTVIQHTQGTSIYYLQGDGAYREIGGPFEGTVQVAARKTRRRIEGVLERFDRQR